MSEEQSSVQYTCPECQAGIMHLEHMVYFTWLYGELITVPDFPGWVCDLCGRREYDSKAITWLNILINPATGKPTRSSKSEPRPPEHPPILP